MQESTGIGQAQVLASTGVGVDTGGREVIGVGKV